MTGPRTAATRPALAALGCLALLAGCSTLPRSTDLPTLDDWPQRVAVLGALDDYGFSARIAVRDGDEGFNGSLRWEQRRDYFDVRVSGPLGAGTVLIAGDPGALEVTDDAGEVTALDDPERDLRERYGWRIPVGSLRYWALGIPDPTSPAETVVDEGGRLERLAQGGWDVSIGQYREAGGRQMPRKLTATQGESRVRLVIDRWTFY